MVDTSSSSVVINQRNISETQHVVFLHGKLRKRLDDRYLLDLARVVRNNGHKVTIYTSEFDPSNCLDDVNVSNIFWCSFFAAEHFRFSLYTEIYKSDIQDGGYRNVLHV